MIIGFFCRCGAQLTGQTEDRYAEELRVTWWERHEGDGHGMTDRITCARVRRRLLRARNRLGDATPDVASETEEG